MDKYISDYLCDTNFTCENFKRNFCLYLRTTQKKQLPHCIEYDQPNRNISPCMNRRYNPNFKNNI